MIRYICPNGTLLHSEHEKCQTTNMNLADIVEEESESICYVADVEYNCNSTSFVWKWDIASLESGGTEKLLIGILLFILMCGLWTLYWLLN